MNLQTAQNLTQEMGSSGVSPTPHVQLISGDVLVRTLKTMPLFQSLPESKVAEFIENSELRWLEEGEHLYREGEVAHGVVTVVSGVVRLYVERTLDRRQWVSRLSSGPSVFGYQELCAGIARKNSAQVQRKAQVLVTRRDYFIEIMNENPGFVRALLQDSNHQYSAQIDMARALLFEEVESRLAALLLSYLRVYGAKMGGVWCIAKDTEINELANALAVNRKSIQRALAYFTSNALVRREKKILYVMDVRKLWIEAGKKSAAIESLPREFVENTELSFVGS